MTTPSREEMERHATFLENGGNKSSAAMLRTLFDELERERARADKAEKTIDKALCDEWFPNPAGPERFGARIMELQHLEEVEVLKAQLAAANERAEKVEEELKSLRAQPYTFTADSARMK